MLNDFQKATLKLVKKKKKINWGLKQMQNMFWSTFPNLQHPFIFKYQIDKDKYVNFHIPIHETYLFNIGLPVKRTI